MTTEDLEKQIRLLQAELEGCEANSDTWQERAQAAEIKLRPNHLAKSEIRRIAIQSLETLVERFERVQRERDDLLELERLCITLIRRLERGDEWDAQLERVRTWVCNRYPDIAGGGGA